MSENDKFNNSSWEEKVYIETAEFIIVGIVSMPKIGKKSRLLTELLNTNKQFLAVKDCSIEFKLMPQKEIQHHKFIELNMSSILLIRPIEND